MVKGQNDFFKTESGKCREGLNRPNNFEVFSEQIIQVLFCGEKWTGILLMAVMKKWQPKAPLRNTKVKMPFKNIFYESAMKDDCSNRPFGAAF